MTSSAQQGDFIQVLMDLISEDLNQSPAKARTRTRSNPNCSPSVLQRTARLCDSFGALCELTVNAISSAPSEPAGLVSAPQVTAYKLTGSLESAIRASNAQFDKADVLDRLRLRMLPHTGGEARTAVLPTHNHRLCARMHARATALRKWRWKCVRS